MTENSNATNLYRVYHYQTITRSIIVQAGSLGELKAMIANNLNSEFWLEGPPECNTDDHEDLFEAFAIDERDIESIDIDEDGNKLLNEFEYILNQE